MVQQNKDGKRLFFRPKSHIMVEEQKLAKFKKSRLWHRSGVTEEVKAGAPLIICPSAGEPISKKIKEVCMNFKAAHNIEVKVFERGGMKISNIAKYEPLSPSTCGRKDCFPCTRGGAGDCSKSCLQAGM